MDADEVEAQDTDMDSGGEEVKATKAKARPAAASKGKSAGKKVATGAAAKGKAASKTRDDAKAGMALIDVPAMCSLCWGRFVMFSGQLHRLG